MVPLIIDSSRKIEFNMPTRLPLQVESILSRGVDLERFGSANWGMSRADALEAISTFRELRIPILGGDVWVVRDGQPSHTYDSWFYQRHAEEPFESFLELSVDRARRYIENYSSTGDDQFLFEIVIGQPDEEK